MKQHFKAVRSIVLLAVMTVVGAITGMVARSYVGNAGEAEPSSVATTAPLQDNAEYLDSDLPSTDPAVPDEPFRSPDVQEPWSAVRTDGPVSVMSNPGTQAAANAVIQGDLMVREGRVSEAVRHYRQMLADAPDIAAVVNVQYRLALCAEALGRHDEALTTYQIVAELAEGQLLGELAMLGQARVFVGRRDLTAAQRLLRRWTLEENLTAARSLPVSSEAVYLLASVAAKAAFEQTTARLWEDNGLALPQSAFEPSNYLPSTFASDVRTPSEPPVGISLLHQLRESAPGSSYLQGRLARISVTRVLQQICDAAKWELDLTTMAETGVRAQTVSLDFMEQSADVVLDLVLAPLGIGWTFLDGRVRVLTLSEMDPLQRANYQRKFAERMIFAALLNEPEHPQAPEAYLLLGNLAFQDGNLATARGHFEKVLQNFPRSKVDAEAWFNAAKVAMAEGDLLRARQALWGSVDASRGHPLEPVALLLSGGNALLFDEPEKAVRPLIRAVTLAGDEDIRARSLLTLASAHLIAGHPEAANVALMEDRGLLHKPSYRDRAALLGCLARFRAASTPARVERDGRTLISALCHSGVEEFTALHDHLVTVEAYRDVGLTEVGIPLLISALKSRRPSPLRTRMQFLLAELLQERGDPKQAEIVLTAMSQEPSPDVSIKSLLALAELHLKQEQPQDAEKICRDLLKQSLNESQRISTLQLLGGIYARRGDRQRAVLCYSGVAPQLLDSTLPRETQPVNTSPAVIPIPSPTVPPDLEGYQ